MFPSPLPHGASDADRGARYADVHANLVALLVGETDAVAAMATVVAELHHAFAAFHWTGFYRTIAHQLLAVGPYQGGHGCTRIPYDRGVCGAAARTAEVQLVPDVHAFEGHIPCSGSTRSEVVVPVFGTTGEVIGVLDIDSDHPAAFDELDARELASIAGLLRSFERL
mgnify:CR=1 FL=1